jgi:PIN domain nuclease of toxin-antitoxin system
VNVRYASGEFVGDRNQEPAGQAAAKNPVLEIPSALFVLEVPLVTIEAAHVLAELQPEPDTRDPFDRLLLAQCQMEGLRLVTTDRKLAVHPLAWRP